MTTSELSRRGQTWLTVLTHGAPARGDFPPSVRVVDAPLAGEPARYIAVLPDPHSPFARARHGETGVREGWALARAVREVIELDRARTDKRALVAIVDVPSQAYGRIEEACGIHQALAGAVDAYATARQAGHPVIGLLVGRAMSGAFLAHGYQANRLIALDDPQVSVHAMSKASAARVTMRSIDALEALAVQVPPMAYDIRSYASLGLLWQLLEVSQSDAPTDDDIAAVAQALEAALRDIRADSARDLAKRLESPHRAASRQVRHLLRTQW